MSEEFDSASINTSQNSLLGSPGWFSKSPSSTTDTKNKDSNNDHGFSKFMKKFGRKSETTTGNLQQEWSRRNQMNLSMGVSTPHLDVSN